MINLTDLRFRSSPRLELRRLSDLPPEQAEPFRELERDADFFGLLVPRAPATINLKSAGRQAAALFGELVTPARLDAALLADREYRDDVIDLVLDGVLEVERDGDFVSGAEALEVLCGPLPEARADAAVTGAGRLSREALLYAQDLEAADSQTLTSALYFYNRIPLSPFWTSRFPGPDEVVAHLGANRGALGSLLERVWKRTPSELSNGWVSWHPRAPVALPADTVTWKLYVSPRPEHVRDAFEVVARVLADHPGSQMKIGSNAAGLLRPDKLVTYFPTRQALDSAAAAMARELAGCPVHGVPFTAPVDADGLLSWGLDPPANERALSWLGRESWRLWLATRLGAAMALAKSARGGAVEPWRFVVERVRRQGVDVETWTPSPELWSSG